MLKLLKQKVTFPFLQISFLLLVLCAGTIIEINLSQGYSSNWGVKI